MIQISDIQIFILSYNRGVYIGETIKSLLSQTVAPEKIYILDNGSTDNTEEFVKDTFDDRLIFIGSDQNNGVLWNFERAQLLANKRYVMVFHDDDLLHPRYLEFVLASLNKYSDVSVVASGMVATSNPSSGGWRNYNFKPVVFNYLSGFAGYVYFGFPFNFGSVVYKTEYFKNTKIDFETFGKIADRPFVFDCVKDGKVILLPGQFVQYRLHSGQDSGTNKNGPYPKETLALHLRYKNIIFSGSWIDKIRYRLNIYFYMKNEFSRFPSAPDFAFKKYRQNAIDVDVLEGIDMFYGLLSKVFLVRYLYKAYRLFARTFGQMS